MPTTKQKLEFVHAMARRTRATVRQCEALLRYAGTLDRLARDDNKRQKIDVNDRYNGKKRERIQRKVTKLCGEIDVPAQNVEGFRKQQCVPVFDGAVLKIRVPDGAEVVVPS